MYNILKNTFDIQFAERKKINKIGSQIANFGFFFALVFCLFLLPAKYLPSEIAIIYLIEFVNRNVYIFISISVAIFLFGEWLKGMRNYEKAELELKDNGILLFSKTRRIELKYDEIKKFHGVMNLIHGLSNMHRLNFVIKTIDNGKYEIRSHKDVFNGLTDHFPDKT